MEGIGPLRNHCDYKEPEEVFHIEYQKLIHVFQSVLRNGELQSPDDDEDDHHDVIFGFSGLYLISHMHIVAQKKPTGRMLWYD